MTIFDGKINAGSGLIIGPGFTEAEFLSSSAGMTAKALVKNGVHHSYKLQNIDISGKNFLPVLYFSDGELVEIHLHSVTDGERNWTKYSSQSETAHKLGNDNWLQKTFSKAPPYAFSWGAIESVLDQKGGMTFVLLRYAKTLDRLRKE